MKVSTNTDQSDIFDNKNQINMKFSITSNDVVKSPIKKNWNITKLL